MPPQFLRLVQIIVIKALHMTLEADLIRFQVKSLCGCCQHFQHPMIQFFAGDHQGTDTFRICHLR